MPDLFKGGSLDMSVTPVPHEAASLVWGDCLVNRIAVLVTLVLLLIELKDLLRLMPFLFRCVSIWKGNMELEHSVNLARTRNTVSLVMALGFCLVADRWGLIAPSFKLDLPAEYQLAVTIGIVSGYVILRRLVNLASRFRGFYNEYNSCLRHSLYNYQILLSVLMILTDLLLVAFRVPYEAGRMVLLVEFGFFALLHLLRSAQILASRCSIFATILYLCALEILPLGILVFVSTL